MADDEAVQVANLELYRSQLSQVESSLSQCAEDSSSNHADLIQLKSDLQELIELTEESLLTLKKNKLLASLDQSADVTSQNTSHNVNSEQKSSWDMDDEFAEFQRAIASCDVENESQDSFSSEAARFQSLEDNSERKDNKSNNDNDDNSSSDDNDDDDDVLNGTKCRVTHSHSWGEMTEHNALIICQEPSLDDQKLVRVVFCNPTHSSMVPCPFYLEGRCRFSDSECRYSHGEVVSVDKIEKFKEPDFSNVHIGSRCLAKDADNVWYPGSVVEILSDYKFKVQYDANRFISTVSLENILPLESRHADCDDYDSVNPLSDDDEDNMNDDDNNDDDVDDDIAIPVYLWKEGQTTELLGEWEKYTKGIGSKLMAKMGYIVGQGLGKNSEGRAEPVPIELLPQGKSLDKIMELRNMAGDKDLFNALKKQKKLQKKIEKDSATNAMKSNGNAENKMGMFDFINKRLNSSKSKMNNKRYEKNVGAASKNISLSDLKGKADRELNIQLLKTDEEIKKTKQELHKMKTSLVRNERQDQVIAKQLNGKVSSLHEYIKTLELSKTFINQELMNRKAHNSLTKF